MSDDVRIERDLLGEVAVPAGSLHGVHTERALENFPLAGRPVHVELARAYGVVKLACARTNRALGAWDGDDAKADAIERACRELADGLLDEHIVVDRLQGGAGTSTNMNVNEVLANRALQLLGAEPGDYARVSPSDDLNLHQSTNDTYPTALRLAAIELLHRLEEQIVALQEAFQAKEQEFAHVVKVGRTELQDAVLTTLGREMGAYAEALNRDRWRIYKCEERLRVVNLGGTAIGTGLRRAARSTSSAWSTRCASSPASASRAPRTSSRPRRTRTSSSRSPASSRRTRPRCSRSAGDLRLLSSGPEAGLGEIRLPRRQAGSSIMPGKVNPVIPEAVSQAALLVFGYDATIATAAGLGSLELNAFLPLVADCLLESLRLLAGADEVLRRFCVEGIEADEERCAAQVRASSAAATALVPEIGYDAACDVARRAHERGATIRDVVVGDGVLTAEQYDELLTAEAVCRLGTPQKRGRGVED